MAVTTRRRSKGAASKPSSGNNSRESATVTSKPSTVDTNSETPPRSTTLVGNEPANNSSGNYNETPSKRQKTGRVKKKSSTAKQRHEVPSTVSDSTTGSDVPAASTSFAISPEESAQSTSSDGVQIYSSSGLTPETVQCQLQSQSAGVKNGCVASFETTSSTTAAAAVSAHNDPTTTNDSDVEVVSPSKIHAFNVNDNHTAFSNDGNSGEMSQEEVQISSSNALNPNIHYPHIRQLCGVHPFDPLTKSDSNAKHCEKCYCFVCDDLVSKCEHWKISLAGDEGGSLGPHCHAHNGDARWMQLKERAAGSRQRSGIGVAKPGGVVRPQSYNPYVAVQNNPYQNILNQSANLSEPSIMHMAELIELTRQELYFGSAGNNRTPSNRGEISFDGANGLGNRRQKKDMRIPEVFLENFRNAAKISDGSSMASAVDLTSPVASEKSTNGGESCMSSGEEIQADPITRKKVEGDIPTLRLYNTFFVEGIKIGWPFPAVMKPQRQMAIHLVKALKNRRHVVLESPTGTGKSAAILCSVLAWQRHHHKQLFAKHDPSSPNSMDLEPKPQNVKIIYCSRTHSQVAQMVSSLKSTPYRPRMAILGSRERLCIHKSIKPRGNHAETTPGINVTNECRNRTRNTEKMRRQFLSTVESDQAYDDDDPPDDLPGDGDGGGGGEESAENQFLSRKKTCPHYRQLTSGRIANLVSSTFVPNNKVDCCSVGGKKSTYGAHDIEDLVSFGVDPYLQKNVAFYRENSSQPFGLELKVNEGRRRGCYVKGAKKGFPADNGTLKEDDKILRVNGSNVSHMNSQEVAELIRDSSNDPLLLDVSRGGSGTLSSSDGNYSPHAACPYYISQALAKDAEIVFAPYNYVLDPGIRNALGIELMNSVVILDEAHNVEDTLREAGSGKFGEFELCELVVMLNNYSLTEKPTGNMIELESSGIPGDASGDVEYLCDLSHSLLIFIEKLIEDLRRSRTLFENNPGAKGAQKGKCFQ